MKARNMHYSSISTLRLLPAALIICAMAQADGRVEFATVSSLPESREAVEILAAIHRLQMRPPDGSWEQGLLDSSERSIARALAPRIGLLWGWRRSRATA